MVGGRGINGREHADVLQSAQMAGTRGFFSRPHAPTCVCQLKGVWAKAGESLGCSGKLREEKEAERERGIHCPEKKNGVPPFIIVSSGSKAHRCLRGTRRGPGRKLSLRRLVEEAKNGIFVKWQKVFDAGLGK